MRRPDVAPLRCAPVGRAFALCLAAACLAGCARSVTVQTVEYSGWKDAVRIENGVVEVVVVPCIGRVMRYARAGGENVLWENPEFAGKLQGADAEHNWNNFGGDKVWPAQQSDWPKYLPGRGGKGRGWPPDTVFDGGAHSLARVRGGVRLVSGVSPRFGARAVREIRLRPGSSSVEFRERIEKIEGPPIPATIWSVTQVRTPRWSFLAQASARFERGWLELTSPKRIEIDERFRAVAGGTIALRGHPETHQKVGSDAPAGWIAAAIGRQAFLQWHAVRAGAEYPDGGAGQEVFVEKGDRGYTELELLSPKTALKPGEAVEETRLWDLCDLPEAAKDDDPRELAAETKRIAERLFGGR